ncbi:MAG: type II toxin-antitoxin system RelE/ParE family toxin [Alphaproteobacteria bacterium]|nr:type II toxin-antitoxin system RelE/ParE family toxin [Alphaproteobacteria bacterium]MBU6471055.1 type II toxin-antitoxin system RelE/ParE family toxin [Alphaproteobacteria bacterium]MDE2012242.1 type II toxin-antitoxin system RelE/ParE family toxin [Alphaproteobacteria bacterium]MDE2074463.1 type II toxin-antitoxin system RelE/ParE family toxin [Alphaproteobacteria bacterium]MDE2352719.1 type II toxin-antitoxin system RelE/ParE family toxin [Alphaproteobacteria bacterium]
MKLIIRQKAAADLQGIRDYIAQDSPRNAQRVVIRIRDAIRNNLLEFPDMGRASQVAGTREWPVPGLPYLIIYRTDAANTRLEILSIVHGARER